METRLSISQVADLTHFSASTLRMWERRHGFPKVQRVGGGQRRYSKRDVDDIHAVLALRMEGLHLRQAIDRVRRDREGPPVTLSRHLHAEGAAHAPLPALWPLRIAFTAIVDEIALRGEGGVVVAAVGAGLPAGVLRRRTEALAAAARVVVLVSPEAGIGDGLENVVHVEGSPQERIGCEPLLLIDRCASALAVVVARGAVTQNGSPGPPELQWTIKPALVRSTTRLALKTLRPHAPDAIERALALLDAEPLVAAEPTDGMVAAGVRMIRYLASSSADPL